MLHSEELHIGSLLEKFTAKCGAHNENFHRMNKNLKTAETTQAFWFGLIL